MRSTKLAENGTERLARRRAAQVAMLGKFDFTC